MNTYLYESRIIELVDSNGEHVVVQQGESFNITGTVKDFDGDVLTSSALSTITLTLYDEETGDVINSKDGTDISGSVSVAGTLTLRLEPDDNTIVSTTLAERAMEAHVARIIWTWNDGTATRTGYAEYRFRVQKVVVAA